MAKLPKTHCKYGHELKGDNLIEREQAYTNSHGEVKLIPNRFCRKCNVARTERIKRHISDGNSLFNRSTEAYNESRVDKED